jgi:3-deoxy-manno-octulosonate cytidylyltransferase (CMP-KDO synthetase)
VDELIERLETSGDEMATAATAFPAGADPANPNMVKVVLTLDGRAMYFSRSVIPHDRDATPREKGEKRSGPTYYLHLGIYAYRRDFLLKYTAWEPTPAELAEKLEQLRALEHGAAIHVVKVERASGGIDTPEQYAEFVSRVTGVKRISENETGRAGSPLRGRA